MVMQVLGGRERVELAVAQVSPVYLDKDATLDRAGTVIAEAAAGGADLVAFPEAWLAGVPLLDGRMGFLAPRLRRGTFAMA